MSSQPRGKLVRSYSLMSRSPSSCFQTQSTVGSVQVQHAKVVSRFPHLATTVVTHQGDAGYAVRNGRVLPEMVEQLA
jgi:hypothetical protein